MSFIIDAAMDAALNYVKNNAVAMHICNAQPADYTAATTTNSLGSVAIDSTDFTGPADGDTSGRKLTVAAQNGISISTTGTASHIAIVSGTELLHVTALSASQAVTSGNTANIGSYKHEITDPA